MTLQQAIGLVLQASVLMTVFGFGLQTTPGDVLDVVRRPSLPRPLADGDVRDHADHRGHAGQGSLRSVQRSIIALFALSISPIPPLLPGKETKADGYFSYALGLLAIVGALWIRDCAGCRSSPGSLFRPAPSRWRPAPSPAPCCCWSSLSAGGGSGASARSSRRSTARSRSRPA